MKLVYPDFVLSPPVVSAISHLDPQFIYSKETTQFPRRHYVDLPRAVAANDIQGAVIVSEILGRVAKKSSDLISDADVLRSPDVSFISFGLSSNDVTFMYLQRDRTPLFEIHEDANSVQYLRVKLRNQWQEFRSTDTHQYGIIVKYRPDPKNNPHRVWMLCAGLGPVGTPASAWYLSQHWQSIERRTRNRDFILVVRAQHYAFTEVDEVAMKVR